MIHRGATCGARGGALHDAYQRGRIGPHADVAQLVEHHLAKVGVAGSNPVVRSTNHPWA